MPRPREVPTAPAGAFVRRVEAQLRAIRARDAARRGRSGLPPAPRRPPR
jgi:hypothetical protein